MIIYMLMFLTPRQVKLKIVVAPKYPYTRHWSTGSHLKQIKWLKQVQRLKRWPRVGASLSCVHLPHKTTLSRQGEVAILSNGQRPTHRVKENEKNRGICSKRRNKIKCQKHTLLKQR